MHPINTRKRNRADIESPFALASKKDRLIEALNSGKSLIVIREGKRAYTARAFSGRVVIMEITAGIASVKYEIDSRQALTALRNCAPFYAWMIADEVSHD